MILRIFIWTALFHCLLSAPWKEAPKPPQGRAVTAIVEPQWGQRWPGRPPWPSPAFKEYVKDQAARRVEDDGRHDGGFNFFYWWQR